MAKGTIYDKYPENLVKLAFKRYPERLEVVQYGPFLDHTGECMDDYMEDINERPRIAYMEGFSEGVGATLITANNIYNESHR